MNPSFALGQRSWCPHYLCSERRCWATPWSRGAGWTQLCVRRPHLITHGTDPERGPRRDVRRVPVKRRAQSAFCAPGLGVGAPVGGSAGEAGSLISDPSWPCVARLPCRKSPAKSAKCPCDPSLLPRRFAPLPPHPRPLRAARCHPERGLIEAGALPAPPVVPQGSPLPIRKERHRARRALEESAAGEGGKEGRRDGGKQGLGEAGAAPGRGLGRVSAQGRAEGVESRRESYTLQGLGRGAPLQKASWGGAACLAPFFRPPPLGTGG